LIGLVGTLSKGERKCKKKPKKRNGEGKRARHTILEQRNESLGRGADQKNANIGKFEPKEQEVCGEQ